MTSTPGKDQDRFKGALEQDDRTQTGNNSMRPAHTAIKIPAQKSSDPIPEVARMPNTAVDPGNRSYRKPASRQISSQQKSPPFGGLSLYHERAQRNSSIASSKTSRPGRTMDSGSVASG
jgi:hypothetical protein